MPTYGYNPNFPTSQGSGIPEKSFGAGPGGLLGAYLQMQQILRARDQQEIADKQGAAYRQQVEALGPDAPTEQRVGVAERFLDPKTLYTAGQSSLDRRAGIEATAAQREEIISQQRLAHEARIAEQQATREQRAEDSKAARDQRMQELQLRLQDARIAGKERADLARELAMMRADQARESAEFKKRNDPNALKAADREQGKKEVTEIVKFLYGNYKELETIGADIDSEQSSLKNMYERAAASGPGQFIAGAVGTEAQQARDQINAGRAGLMGAMKKATGMGATQLNSNVELKFYMNMATDVSKARWANRAALAYLDKTYGLGAGITSDPKDIARLKEMLPGYSQTGVLPSISETSGWSIKKLP